MAPIGTRLSKRHLDPDRRRDGLQPEDHHKRSAHRCPAHSRGKTTLEICRCLERYIARELYRQLTRAMNLPAQGPLTNIEASEDLGLGFPPPRTICTEPVPGEWGGVLVVIAP